MTESTDSLNPQFSGMGRDYKLKKCFEFIMQDHIGPSLSPTFEPVMESFYKSFQRQRSIIFMILFSMHFARELERFEAIAEHELLGKINPDVANSPKSNALIGHVRQQFHSSLFREGLVSDHDGEKYQRETRFKLADMFNRWEMTVTSASEPMSEGTDNLLASMVLGTWTAFEAMAHDLWETALNAHPQILSQLAGKRNRLSKKRNASSEPLTSEGNDDGESKKVDLNFIQRYGYDLRDKMGTVLKRKFSFDRLDGAREAYACAFSQKSDTIDKFMSDTCLDELSALRNVLVHRSGYADETYVRQSKYLGIPKVTLGEKILLDGEIVFPLLERVRVCASGLVFDVQRWTTEN